MVWLKKTVGADLCVCPGLTPMRLPWSHTYASALVSQMNPPGLRHHLSMPSICQHARPAFTISSVNGVHRFKALQQPDLLAACPTLLLFRKWRCPVTLRPLLAIAVSEFGLIPTQRNAIPPHSPNKKWDKMRRNGTKNRFVLSH